MILPIARILAMAAFAQAAITTTIKVTATNSVDSTATDVATVTPSASSSTDSDDSDDGTPTTIYSTQTVTDAEGDVLTTIYGSVSTYYSVGYSQSVITYTTSVPVTSTYTSRGDNTVVVVTTFVQGVETTSCVTSVSTSLIVSTVSTERITMVSCADKECQTTMTSTYLAKTSNGGLVTISTLSGDAIASDISTVSGTGTGSASGSGTSGKSTVFVTQTGTGTGTGASGSATASASRAVTSLTGSAAATLTFQDNAARLGAMAGFPLFVAVAMMV